LSDLWALEEGRTSPTSIRRIDVPDALVDTGATTLALPTRLIAELGLRKSYVRNAVATQGRNSVNVYEAVRLTLLDRFCTVDVMEVPDEVPVLIGQIPLEMLDLVVDPQGRRLIGNPAHGGEHVLELL
jgi:predicted aspartyl protease